MPKLGRCDWPVIFCQAGGGRVRNHPVRYIIDPDTAHTHTLNFRMGEESTNRVIPFAFLFGLLRQVILLECVCVWPFETLLYVRPPTIHRVLS